MNAIIKPANPQGKGLVSVLDSLQQAKQRLNAPAKTIEQISGELFTSLFVLNAQIRFKPVIQQTYWLYCKNRRYQLSLIAPQQWSTAQSGRFIGACELQSDLTWTLALSEDCAADAEFLREIAERRLRLQQQLQQAAKIEDVLPVYVPGLPFHARVLAAALACSLQQSMHKGGIAGLSFEQAQRGLPTGLPTLD